MSQFPTWQQGGRTLWPPTGKRETKHLTRLNLAKPFCWQRTVPDPSTRTNKQPNTRQQQPLPAAGGSWDQLHHRARRTGGRQKNPEMPFRRARGKPGFSVPANRLQREGAAPMTPAHRISSQGTRCQGDSEQPFWSRARQLVLSRAGEFTPPKENSELRSSAVPGAVGNTPCLLIPRH